jgi:hypothetical protein
MSTLLPIPRVSQLSTVTDEKGEISNNAQQDLEQPSTFGPFMRQFIPLLQVTRGASKDKVTDIVSRNASTSGATQWVGMIYMVDILSVSLLKLCVSTRCVVASPLLPFELLLNLCRGMNARNRLFLSLAVQIFTLTATRMIVAIVPARLRTFASMGMAVVTVTLILDLLIGVIIIHSVFTSTRWVSTIIFVGIFAVLRFYFGLLVSRLTPIRFTNPALRVKSVASDVPGVSIKEVFSGRLLILTNGASDKRSQWNLDDSGFSKGILGFIRLAYAKLAYISHISITHTKEVSSSGIVITALKTELLWYSIVHGKGHSLSSRQRMLAHRSGKAIFGVSIIS